VLSGEVNANLVSMYEPDPEMVRRNFIIQADDTGRVHRVIEKPRYVNSQLKGCGLYVFDPHIFDAIRRTPRTAMRDEYEITDSIQILINDGYVTHHHAIVERDLNLTKPADLAMINLIELARAGLPRLVDDSAQLADGVQVEHSVIGRDVTVQHPIRITNSVIMAGVTVSATADLDSVVMDGEHTVYCPGVAAQAAVQLQGRA
jgi:dTDP-glucose pyrophosphorylase